MKPIALELLNQHYKQADVESDDDEHPLDLSMKQTIFNVLQKKYAFYTVLLSVIMPRP